MFLVPLICVFITPLVVHDPCTCNKLVIYAFMAIVRYTGRRHHGSHLTRVKPNIFFPLILTSQKVNSFGE